MTGESTSPSCTSWDNDACVGTPFCPPRCPRFIDKEGASILITPLEDSQLPDLLGMYDRLGANDAHGLPIHSQESTRQWLSELTDNGWNLVASCNDLIVGHVGVAPADVSEPELVIVVEEEYQGRGIGHELLCQLTAFAAVREYDGIQLHVERSNETAIAVYQKTSFEVSSEQFGTLLMRLSLEDPIAEAAQRPPALR